MISENIKNLRKEKQLTQKDLADLLSVTSQAVSRWENGDVEPSVDTISSMAKIFGVTTDEIIYGPDSKPKPEIERVVEEKVIVQQAKPVLAICEQCKQPIYESENIVTVTHRHGRGHSTTGYICSDCDRKNKAEERRKIVEYAHSQRIKSFVWSAVISLILLAIGIAVIATQEMEAGTIAILIIIPILTFTFSSCLFLKNNFIGDAFISIASWGFVKFPGLIFSFDLDGFIWLIGMKILFLIIGFLLGLAAVALALFICMPLSLIAYPFAIIKNINNPEETEMF